MPKNYDEIYECTCPFCGKVGNRVNTSTFEPKFYCLKCKLWFKYKQVSVFNWKILLSRDKYKFDDWHHSKYCEKHSTAYAPASYHTDIAKKCYNCDEEAKQDKIRHGLRKLNFTQKQIEFVYELIKSDFDIDNRLAKLYPELKKEEED